ncbi:hypothetical protein QZH41_004117 [Actinostola sp. cb2023]|nr:hypothetical protein QZH41_004117 [Actinostola sp. cb2023]
MQTSMDANFEETKKDMSAFCYEIKNAVSSLKTEVNGVVESLEAAWADIESLKKKESLREAELERLIADNDSLKQTTHQLRERAIKLENYTRRENVRLLNVPEQPYENCKTIVEEIMEVVGMETTKVEFHAVHRVGRVKEDQRWPRAIIARFISSREVRNDFWGKRKELAKSTNFNKVILVPDYAPETAKENRKLSNALKVAKQKNLFPAYIKRNNLVVQGRSYTANDIPADLVNEHY